MTACSGERRRKYLNDLPVVHIIIKNIHLPCATLPLKVFKSKFLIASSLIWNTAPHSKQQWPIGLMGSLQCGMGWQLEASLLHSWSKRTPFCLWQAHLVSSLHELSLKSVLSTFLNADWPNAEDKNARKSFTDNTRPSMAMLLKDKSGADCRSTTYELLMGKTISSLSQGTRSSCGVALL